MMLKVVCFLLVAGLLIVCNGQGGLPLGVSRRCPSCTDDMDPSSCTGTIDCYNTEDVCELRIDASDNNKLLYFCIHKHACSNHEAHGCDAKNGDVCSFCCKTIDDCKKQREQLFSTQFTTSGGSGGGNSTSP